MAETVESFLIKLEVEAGALGGSIAGAVAGSGAALVRAVDESVSGAASGFASVGNSIGDSISSGIDSAMKASIGSVLMGAVGGIVDAIGDGLSQLNALADTAQRLNMPVGELEAMRLGFASLGEPADKADAALGKLNRKLGDAINGNKGAADLFASLGVAITDANGAARDAGDVMGDVQERLQEIGPGADVAAAGLRLFGSDGDLLAQKLAGSTGRLDEFGGLLNEVGGDLLPAGAVAASGLTDAMTQLREAGDLALRIFVAPIAIALNAVSQELGGAAGEANLFATALKAARFAGEMVQAAIVIVSGVVKGFIAQFRIAGEVLSKFFGGDFAGAAEAGKGFKSSFDIVAQAVDDAAEKVYALNKEIEKDVTKNIGVKIENPAAARKAAKDAAKAARDLEKEMTKAARVAEREMTAAARKAAAEAAKAAKEADAEAKRLEKDAARAEERAQKEAESAQKQEEKDLAEHNRKVKEAFEKQLFAPLKQAGEAMLGGFLSMFSSAQGIGAVLADTVSAAMSGGPIAALMTLLGSLLKSFDGFGALVETSSQVLSGVLSALAEPLQMLTDAIGSFFVFIGDFIASTSGVLSKFMGALGDVLSLVMTFLDALKPVIESITGLFATVISAVAKLLEPVVKWLGALMRGLAPLVDVVGVLFEVLAPLIEQALKPLEPALKFLGFVVALIAGAIAGVVRAVLAIADFFTGGQDKQIKKMIASTDEAIKKSGHAIATAFSDEANVIAGSNKLLADETEKAAESMSKFSQSLTNAPAGFRYAAASYGAQDVRANPFISGAQLQQAPIDVTLLIDGEKIAQVIRRNNRTDSYRRTGFAGG